MARNPEKIDEMAKATLRRAGLPQSISRAIVQEMTNRLSESLHELRPEIDRAHRNIISALPETLRTSIKGAHNKALGKTIAPEIRVKNYKTFRFSVAELPSANMILGDCVTVFHVEGTKPFKTISENDDMILAALLPITATRVMIGSRNPYRLDAENLRTAIARCSLEFFIAPADSKENQSLAKMIGSDALLLTDGELDDIMRKASS